MMIQMMLIVMIEGKNDDGCFYLLYAAIDQDNCNRVTAPSVFVSRRLTACSN